MLRNYLTIAVRNLWKQRGYAFINIIGLSVGLAFCVLIFLYVHHEWTYDRFHANADRIYRVHRATFSPDGSLRGTDPYLPMPLGPAMQADFPEVEAYVRFRQGRHFVRTGTDAVEEEILFADPAVFDVFTFPLQRGNPATALDDLNSIVLSEQAARRYFGDADPMGRTLSIRLGTAYQDFVVTGVAADLPTHSSIRFDLLVPFAKLADAFDWIRTRSENWHFSAFLTYVLLDERATLAADADRLLRFRRTYYPDEVTDLRARGLWSGDGVPATYRMQALPAIHLDPAVNSGLTPPSDPRYAYILAALALAVLGIACINFMTLAIGRSAGRAREIGMRKVVGARRPQLMLQFWSEALLLSVLALAVGLLLVVGFLPTFNTLTQMSLHLGDANPGLLGVLLVGAVLLTGLAAGSYPAVVLSGFHPIATLKNTLRLSGSNAFTKTLVVAQFGLSVFLISSTLVMLHQVDYLRTTPLGFDKEHLVVIPTNGVDAGLVLGRYRSEVGRRSDIVGLTATSGSFARGGARVGFEYGGELKQVNEFRVEANYVDLMGMELVAGRSFDPNLATDSTRSVLVNEALVRDFGWTDPLGQPLTGLTESPDTDPVVVGVLKDYHFESLETDVEPLMLTLDPHTPLHYLLVRLAPGAAPATLDALQAAWQRIAGDVPFTYSFLDEDLDAQYRDHERWSRIVGYGGGFAILIACLGLFGLTALTVAGRTKEVGIRKVLGASVASVTVLLSREFAQLVGIALVLAAPAAYLATNQWLDTFASRIEIRGVEFLSAGLVALGVALLTVGYQAVRAALTDPVKSLRYE